MEEKKIIYYARTYRRIKGSMAKCILYMCLLIIPALIVMFLCFGNITKEICEFAAKVLEKYIPGACCGIQTGNYGVFGELSFLSMKTTMPEFSTCLLHVAVSLGIIIVTINIPWKGRPLAIYTILNAGIHFITGLWFVFAQEYFPYSLTTYSELYILQEVGIWTVFLVMTGLVTGIVGNRYFLYKLLTVIAVMSYSFAVGIIRYIVFLYLLSKYSMLYMTLLYFVFGPMFDFMYLVMIYAFFVHKMVKLYDSEKNREVWEWS